MTPALLLALAASQPNPFLAEARVLFQAQDYAKCLRRIEQAVAWQSSVDEEAEVSLYRGLCRFGSGDEAAAAGDFEHALRISSKVTLPAWTSPRIREAFSAAKVRARVGDVPPAQPLVQVVPGAQPGAPPTPPLVTAPAPRRIGPVPPLVAGGVAAAALACGIGFGVHARALETQSFGTTFEADTRAAALGARDFATAANASYGVAAAAALTAGILVIIDLAGSR